MALIGHSQRPPNTSLPLPDPNAYPGEPREYARALMERKDQIEKEILALEDVQKSHGASSSTPLVDPEGYPRGDIDVYSIRHARASLARLRTDRTIVQDLLASALEKAFSRDANSPTTSRSNPSQQSQSTSSTLQTNGHPPHLNPIDDMPEKWPEAPIARVNSVAPGSPAHDAGLTAGDKIYSFGDVAHATPGGLQAVGALVSRSEGQTLTVLISRSREGASEEHMRLRLTPRSGWGGRGLLGCHILPHQETGTMLLFGACYELPESAYIFAVGALTYAYNITNAV